MVERDALWHERVILCDLLIGRRLRLQAAEGLERALTLEALALRDDFAGGWQSCIDGDVLAAASVERMAAMAEQGKVLWGNRFNRHGQRPEEL